MCAEGDVYQSVILQWSVRPYIRCRNTLSVSTLVADFVLNEKWKTDLKWSVDTPDNMRKILSPYRDQTETLKTMWRDGKRGRMFLFGDYDFFLKLYGLLDAQSVHPCLYCIKGTNPKPTHIQPRKHHLTQRGTDWERLRQVPQLM